MSGDRGNVLVVEDSPTQAEQTRLLLEGAGYAVEVAGNGRAALERARAARPDLIVSDIVMPEMDGYALCQALKRNEVTRRIPFIFLTERHAPMDIIEGLLRGADNFIPKGAADEYVLARVRRIFEQLQHRKAGEVGIEILVRVDGREIPISADKQQIFELLISSVEEAGRASEKLHEAQRLLQEHAWQLEARVEERTRELRAAEERYRTLVEQLPAPVYVAGAGPGSAVTYVSPQIEVLLGWPASDWMEKPDFWSEIVHPDDADRIRVAVERLRATGGPLREEYRLRTRDGRWVWVRDDASLVPGTGTIQGVLFDMTERRQAEAAVRESEARYRTLVETAREAVLILDASGRITFVNARAVEMVGRPADDLIGRSAEDLLFEEDVEAHRARLRRRRQGLADDYEVRLRRPDGSAIWGLMSATALRDGHGRFVGAFGMFTDITKRKQAELALQQSEARLKEAQRIARLGSWEYDVPRDLIHWSDEVYELFEVERQAFPGTYQAFLERVHPDDRHTVDAAYRSSVAEKRPYDVYHRLLFEAGRIRYVHERGETVFDERGAALRSVGTAQDVTAEREAELALRKLSEALEQASASIMITDRDGRIEYVNRAFCEVTGYTAEEVHGRNPRLLKSGATAPAVYAEMWGKIAAGETWHGELCNRRKNGEEFWQRSVIAPVYDSGGSITHYIASSLDVTHSRQLEQRLVQGQKMEAIGRLAGGVAHDFNNLLGVITGQAELATRRLESGHPVRGRLEEIVKTSERAARLTRQLLAFSRKQVMEVRPLDLNAVVQDVEKMLRRVIGEDVEMVLKLQPDLNSVKADPGQLEQVILNLAVNARDAMPAGGTLRIETSLVEVDGSQLQSHTELPGGQYVCLSVSDTGEGMDAETLSHIFEPFFTTKGQGKGTGLGLATVYGIVSQSGGSVAAHSEPGHGSTLRVYLPAVVARPQAEGRRVDAGPIPAGHGETVLLVEDEPSLRAVVCDVLEAGGYTVIDTPSPPDAVRAARERQGTIHLLLTDVVMPGMTGGEVHSRVVELHPETRVLFMSGYPGDAVARRGVVCAGVYIQKPFTRQALLGKVREVLDTPPWRAST